MELVEYLEGEGKDDGLHIPGLREHDSETLCGLSLTGDRSIDVDADKPSCRHCISIMRALIIERKYTKKMVNSW